MNCSECGHDDMVHFMFTGCCGHAQCPCEGNSTDESRCRKPRHGEDCWWAYPSHIDRAALERQTVKILALHLSGFGTRRIAGRLGIRRQVVIATIRESAASLSSIAQSPERQS